MEDQKLSIAVCKRRTDKTYKNGSVTWVAFTAKIKKTHRSHETVAEYRAMGKPEQAAIKDIGGFVAGSLKDGLRKSDTVLSRSMITLDADFADDKFLDQVKSVLPDCAWALYSTHKHTAQKPKYRLIVPLIEAVPPDEYEAAARWIADEIGMNYFDPTTFQPSRMMFWPSTSKDGEFVFQESDAKDFLFIEEILAKYPDWKDTSFWPVPESETGVRLKTMEKLGDPGEKPGVVGDFCRAYTVQEAIAAFIPEVYEPCENSDRYTYTAGSSAGGLVIYNDGQYAYSNHATDPAGGGRCCNAFDLVRIHLYEDQDSACKEGTPVNKKPSYQAMKEMASKDKAVIKARLVRQHEEALDEFADELDSDLELESEAPRSQQKLSKDELLNAQVDLLSAMQTNKEGIPVSTTDNIMLVLKRDPRIKDRIGGIDKFRNMITKKGSLPWWRYDPQNPYWQDTDDAGFRYYLEKEYQIQSRAKVDDALALIHEENSWHPIRDYLKSLEWDGIERLDTLLIDMLGAQDAADGYTRFVTRKWFTAAVKRIFEPGCKFDYVLVLCGPQGIGKSSILKIMGGEGFSDSITSVQGKEGYEAVNNGVWLAEMAEFTAGRKSDNNQIKQFLTKSEDRYREAYGKRVKVFKRQCVIAATANDHEFLRDTTGNRRFWPVDVDGGQGNLIIRMSDDLRDQLWAEAVYRYKEGEQVWLSEEQEKIAAVYQDAHTVHNVREDQIAEYLDTLLPEDWYSMEPHDRRLWLLDPEHEEGSIQRHKVCALEIWVECFGNPSEKFPNGEQQEIKGILDRLGWMRTPNPIRIDAFYKRQRAFKRGAFG